MGTWLVYAILVLSAEITMVAGTIITTVLGLPIVFVNALNKRFPRKETKDVLDTEPGKK